jgi:hypothetical protein
MMFRRLLLIIALIAPAAEAVGGQCESGSLSESPGVAISRGNYALFVRADGSVTPIFYKRVGRYAVYEGDIILGPFNEIQELSRSGTLDFDKESKAFNLSPFGLIAKTVLTGGAKWPGGIVPYQIESGLPHQDLISQAMNAWAQKTPVRFIARTTSNMKNYPNYVQFTSKGAKGICLSTDVGMQGGAQPVRLSPNCGRGQIIHELGHVLGLFHEQNRSDRDRYVTIHVKNISYGYKSQFETDPKSRKDVGPYDYDSIMHYGSTQFSCNKMPTITANRTLPPGVQIGQRDHLSSGDIQVITQAYK